MVLNEYESSTVYFLQLLHHHGNPAIASIPRMSAERVKFFLSLEHIFLFLLQSDATGRVYAAAQGEFLLYTLLRDR